tara:strand:+ start:529 stop:1092 length:564 start_codon:yes stop_codon:yes gene_type:complete
MIKIGITGMLASGKSTVAKILSKNKYPVFNADNEVKKIYKRNIFKRKIYKELKTRKKNEIKKIVCQNPKKLKLLEKIIHPIVRKELIVFIKKNKKKKILLFEIPLLVENKLINNFHKILFVNSKRSIRLRRFLKKGNNTKLFNTLNKRQLSPFKKIKFCHYVINNNYSLKVLKHNTNVIYDLIISNK